MVMTNLFRDQLDRYGEIDITMNILETMIKTVPDMKVIVNGDDDFPHILPWTAVIHVYFTESASPL